MTSPISPVEVDLEVGWKTGPAVLDGLGDPLAIGLKIERVKIPPGGVGAGGRVGMGMGTMGGESIGIGFSIELVHWVVRLASR